MINEISQNAARVSVPQQHKAPDSINPVQEQFAVEASNVTRLAGSEKAAPDGLTQSAVVGKQEVEKVVENLNDFAQSVDRQLQFSVDEESGKTIVKVVDAETGETVRAIPPEEIINMQKQLKEVSEKLFQQEEKGVSLLFQGKA